MSTVSLEQLKEAAKSIMKKQGKGYQELAGHLGISLVSVKRVMSKEEISLSRFLEICDWLDVSIADLEKIAQHNQSHEKVRFTEEQDQFLAKNPEYLSFLFHMCAEQSPEQIQKQFNLSNKSLNLYLVRLEKYNLIKKVSGRYKVMQKEFPSPIPYGELQRVQYKSVVDTSVSFFSRFQNEMRMRKDPEADKGTLTTLVILGISRQSYLAWYEKYLALQAELHHISTIEDKIESIKDKKTVALFHMHAVVEEKSPEIEGITNMFGKVVELSK
ncbi:MAG: helix-turn-helix domain-containing protein [Pseudobdellovibrio sp.]